MIDVDVYPSSQAPSRHPHILSTIELGAAEIASTPHPMQSRCAIATRPCGSGGLPTGSRGADGLVHPPGALLPAKRLTLIGTAHSISC